MLCRTQTLSWARHSFAKYALTLSIKKLTQQFHTFEYIIFYLFIKGNNGQCVVLNYCIIKQFQIATYTKYVTPVTAKICQHAWFIVHGIQNSVTLLTNISIIKANCSPCYSDCTQYTPLVNENYKQCILLASGPTSYTQHQSTARPLHTYQMV
jgi:hypothetical protein